MSKELTIAKYCNKTHRLTSCFTNTIFTSSVCVCFCVRELCATLFAQSKRYVKTVSKNKTKAVNTKQLIENSHSKITIFINLLVIWKIARS